MKAFNLARAKAGDPVEIYQPSDGKWWPAVFVGVRKSGTVLLDHRDGYLEWEVAPDRVNELLRMAPKKVTWYCSHHLYEGMPSLYRSLTPIRNDAVDSWLGEPFTIEVEE